MIFSQQPSATLCSSKEMKNFQDENVFQNEFFLISKIVKQFSNEDVLFWTYLIRLIVKLTVLSSLWSLRVLPNLCLKVEHID